ncbi:hypothetical protein C4D60_Mb04t34250 [Musa balbisiana]|uniref:Protein kinase domain-containing protein n=1 Tax=Musa balbisiana TaxID=52838 RepID=A0A4S8KGN5_MUSBA|nr:hypothetical protein C4D60_Mb04t34250 [Musa balbisiana]
MHSPFLHYSVSSSCLAHKPHLCRQRLLSFIVHVTMFRRYRMPLCCWCGNADDLELGPARARVADSPDAEKEAEEEKGVAARRFRCPEIESLTGKFATAAVVGEGGCSTVYLARLPDSSLAALKLHRPSERLHRAFRQELDVLLRLRHPHIVRLLGYCDDREEEGVLVFEYAPNGNLHEKLHGGGEVLPWARRMAIAYQVAQALDYLHEGCDPQVVHGDVKAANTAGGEALRLRVGPGGLLSSGGAAALRPRHGGGIAGLRRPHYPALRNVYSFGLLLLECSPEQRRSTRSESGG